jgi:D-alanine transaminase
MPLIDVNGSIVPAAKAVVPAMDRGFLFGDAVYEVIKVDRGVPLFPRHHLARLENSLRQARIPAPAGLARELLRYLDATRGRSGSLYLEISRGAHPRSHLPPAGLKPTVMLFLQDYRFPTPAEREKGYALHAVRDIRWRRCDIKATSLMGAVLCKLEARDRGADEVVFHDGRGRFTEAGSTNFYAVRDGTVFTHPLGGAILKGVTRTLLKAAAKEAGIRWSERAPRVAEIGTWDEAFVTGTLTGVMPVVRIDGARIGRRMGPVTRRLLEAFERLEAADFGAWPEARRALRTGDHGPAKAGRK